jgi:curli biogenesis system outer membrane secretion channel CsgG
MTTGPWVKGLNMVTRNGLIAAVLAAGSLSVAAHPATAAEPAPIAKAPVLVGVAVDRRTFRSELESYMRELNVEMRNALSEELKHALPTKIEVASNELRARG